MRLFLLIVILTPLALWAFAFYQYMDSLSIYVYNLLGVLPPLGCFGFVLFSEVEIGLYMKMVPHQQQQIIPTDTETEVEASNTLLVDS